MRWLPLILLVVGGLVLVLRGETETIAGFSPELFASVIAMAALALFIGSSALSGYQGRYGQAIKHLALWGLLILALVAGYSYRGEFTRFANRITGELMPPGHPQVTEMRGSGERSVRLRRRNDGHFIARVEVNGSPPIAMLVDTGASTVVLRSTDAAQLGIDVQRLSFTVPVQTANGLSYSAAVRLREVAIGGIVVGGVDALVARPGALKESLLGMSFLRRLRSYEFSGDFLTLRG